MTGGNMTNKSYWVHTVNSSEGLSSVDRINEVLFGLIMVLTFTCSISAATQGHEEISTILWSALGCNVAWGFVDAFMYVFSVSLERGEAFTSIRKIRSANSDTVANDAVKEALPGFVTRLLKDDHFAHLRNEIKALPEPPTKVFLTLHDLRQAFAIFLLVFVSTFPVTIPFIYANNVIAAMRISNAIALMLLFITGLYLGKKTGRSKILTGIIFAVIGVVLVLATMALGG
jgi:hypothetical protein